MKYLPSCLEGILTLDLDCEVIVVDSNSTDGTREYLEKMTVTDARIRLALCNKRTFWSEANQIGLDLSHGDWICLSNPDIKFDETFRKFYENCQDSADILVAAPQLIWPDGKSQRPAKTFTPELSLYLHTRVAKFLFKILRKKGLEYLYPCNSSGEKFTVAHPQGSLFMFKRQVLDSLRGHLWNRGYLNGVSDTDAFLNMRLLGYHIWLLPKYRIVHYGSYITKRFPGWIEPDQSFGLVLYFRYHHLSNRVSPRLYSLLFGCEGVAAVALDLVGRVLKPENKFFNPRLSAWLAGQRMLGLARAWRFKII